MIGTVYYKTKTILVRDGVRDDCFSIAKAMRQSDIDEVWATRHFSPAEAMLYCYVKSTTMMTVESFGFPIYSFGIVPDNFIGKSASIWMLSTEGIAHISKTVVRNSKRFIEQLLDIYPFLYNFVDIRNELSIKWLKWCGAQFGKTIPYGLDQRLFRYFYFGR